MKDPCVLFCGVLALIAGVRGTRLHLLHPEQLRYKNGELVPREATWYRAFDKLGVAIAYILGLFWIIYALTGPHKHP